MVTIIDRIANEKGLNRSECIERLLSKAVGGDDADWVEFFRLQALPHQLQAWMRHADVFNDLKGDEGLTELVLRVTRKQWDAYMKQRSGKGNRKP